MTLKLSLWFRWTIRDFGRGTRDAPGATPPSGDGYTTTPSAPGLGNDEKTSILACYRRNCTVPTRPSKVEHKHKRCSA